MLISAIPALKFHSIVYYTITLGIIIFQGSILCYMYIFRLIYLQNISQDLMYILGIIVFFIEVMGFLLPLLKFTSKKKGSEL